MSALRQATELNTRGVDFLASGKVDMALPCFKRALSVLASTCSKSNNLVSSPHRRAIPLILCRLSKEPTSDEVFLIPMSSSMETTPLTAEIVSLHSAAVVFNCALTMEYKALTRKGQLPAPEYESLLQKSCRLYDKCLHVLGMVPQELSWFHQTQLVARKTVQRLATNYYRQGDYPRVQILFRVLFQWRLNDILDRDVQDMDDTDASKSTTARVA